MLPWIRAYPPPLPLSLCITARWVGDHCRFNVEYTFGKEENNSLALHLLFRPIVPTPFCVCLRGTAVLLRLIFHNSVITPSLNQTMQYSFLRLLSLSNSDVLIMRWGVLRSRLNNAPGVLCRQHQTQTLPSGGGASHVHI